VVPRVRQPHAGSSLIAQQPAHMTNAQYIIGKPKLGPVKVHKINNPPEHLDYRIDRTKEKCVTQNSRISKMSPDSPHRPSKDVVHSEHQKRNKKEEKTNLTGLTKFEPQLLRNHRSDGYLPQVKNHRISAIANVVLSLSFPDCLDRVRSASSSSLLLYDYIRRYNN
jgi:hypothetical protein